MVSTWHYCFKAMSLGQLLVQGRPVECTFQGFQRQGRRWGTSDGSKPSSKVNQQLCPLEDVPQHCATHISYWLQWVKVTFKQRRKPANVTLARWSLSSSLMGQTNISYVPTVMYWEWHIPVVFLAKAFHLSQTSKQRSNTSKLKDVLQNWPGLPNRVDVRKGQTKGLGTVSNEKMLKRHENWIQPVILDSILDERGEKPLQMLMCTCEMSQVTLLGGLVNFAYRLYMR